MRKYRNIQEDLSPNTLKSPMRVSNRPRKNERHKYMDSKEWTFPSCSVKRTSIVSLQIQ